MTCKERDDADGVVVIKLLDRMDGRMERIKLSEGEKLLF